MARGALRLALKKAGLDSLGRNLTLLQVRVVFDKLMAGQLERQGVRDAAGVCETVMEEVSQSAPQGTSTEVGVDQIFRRLGNA